MACLFINNNSLLITNRNAVDSYSARDSKNKGKIQLQYIFVRYRTSMRTS